MLTLNEKMCMCSWHCKWEAIHSCPQLIGSRKNWLNFDCLIFPVYFQLNQSFCWNLLQNFIQSETHLNIRHKPEIPFEDFEIAISRKLAYQSAEDFVIFRPRFRIQTPVTDWGRSQAPFIWFEDFFIPLDIDRKSISAKVYLVKG